MSKYTTNVLIFLITCTASAIILFWIYSTNSHNLLSWLISLPFTLICLHYILNLLHIASHKSISKKRWFNDFAGHVCSILVGFSYDVFRTTHLLHHAYANNPDKDPDYAISTTGSLWWIAFRVPMHDHFFFKQKLHKKDNNLRGYILDRLVQLTLVSIVVVTGSSTVFLYFWVLPLLIIGSSYGLYQFYFPHFSTTTVDNWRRKNKLNMFQKTFLFTVDFCSYYHFKHHQQVWNNNFYFPFLAYVLDLKQKRPLRVSLQESEFIKYRN